jgi:BTB/POZ domain
MEDDLEYTLRKLPELMKKREKELERREEELRKLQARLETEYPNHGKSEDILSLNVGGTPITVFRRTLTQIGGSVLANNFGGRWDEKIKKDPEGRYFIDQDFNLFEPLVSYLRELSYQTDLTKFPKSPSFQDQNLQRKFNTMVDYYGMTLGVFPISCHVFDDENAHVADYPDIEITSNEKKTYCLLPKSESHGRLVNSFELVLGEHSTAQIGWADCESRSLVTEPVSGGHVGVGYANLSIAYDAVRGGIVESDNFTECPDVSVKEGTVIRCEDKGKVWKFDGEPKIAQESLWIPDIVTIPDMGTAGWIPCVTVKGTFRITHIELDF